MTRDLGNGYVINQVDGTWIMTTVCKFCSQETPVIIRDVDANGVLYETMALTEHDYLIGGSRHKCEHSNLTIYEDVKTTG